jgi:cation:H+ antiporter
LNLAGVNAVVEPVVEQASRGALLAKHQAAAPTGAAVPTQARSRVGRELLLVLAGLAAMVGGATVLVEAVRRISGIEETQTKLSLTVVGFATAFELIVLAVAAAA